LHDGRDRLLELNSYRAEPAHRLVAEIEKQDDDPALDEFMLSVLDQYGINVEEIGFRTYRLGAAGAFVDSFPGLPADGFTVTSDRDRALQREDIQFLTWDHPLVTGAIDLILGSEKGNSSFARMPDTSGSGLILEAIYLLECVAPAALHIDRFLPPTPVHVLIDEHGDPCDGGLRPLKKAAWNGKLLGEDQGPQLVQRSFQLAKAKVAVVVAHARREMSEQLGYEIERLQQLKKVNRSVRVEEIQLLLKQRREIDECLGQSRLRLDAIRLIQRG
jgi:ATP-dependent helicase HepA